MSSTTPRARLLHAIAIGAHSRWTRGLAGKGLMVQSPVRQVPMRHIIPILDDVNAVRPPGGPRFLVQSFVSQGAGPGDALPAL